MKPYKKVVRWNFTVEPHELEITHIGYKSLVVESVDEPMIRGEISFDNGEFKWMEVGGGWTFVEYESQEFADDVIKYLTKYGVPK